MEKELPLRIDRSRTYFQPEDPSKAVLDIPVTHLRAPSEKPAMGRPEFRPSVRGKFIFIGNDKFYIRGVTYGAFRPDDSGNEYHDPGVIERDFAQIAASGFNSVRIPHTMPPRSLLDIASRHALRVMVGLSAEQYVGYLIDKKGAPDIEELVRAKVRGCAGHPALLCYAIGNELPASIVRWLGPRKVERYLRRLYRAAKAEDPGGLFTYVNYPTTEYLRLPFVDICSFNVYLESQDSLELYLARIQNHANDKPLILSEVGLDSLRNGEHNQARILDWQVRTASAAGCAGAFIFAWTDEWYRAGEDVMDWEFGLTTRDRRPKPAMAAVREAFSGSPFPPNLSWPRISVIVCSYNGASRITECFAGLKNLKYPNFEVIVVNDGSDDETGAIALRNGFRLINTQNGGLSRARNLGLHASNGEIVAYIDDDAQPDEHWLSFLAHAFMTSDHVGIGGPNIPPPDTSPTAECVANAPGNPMHVLLTDREAEHIPGCNMAIRSEALKAIGGFDPRFRIAGDDVDVCWRLQQRGWTLGFSPGAMVWHRRRDSISAFWKQQMNYGKAEAMLERKWPEKYNLVGHLSWKGRLYGNGSAHSPLLGRCRIYFGVWGTGAFQSIYGPAPGILHFLPLMPEEFLLTILLAGMFALALVWKPLVLIAPLLALSILVPLIQAVLNAAQAQFRNGRHSRLERVKMHILTVFLHMLQPAARLYGRLRYGLIPWRRRGFSFFSFPRRRSLALWSEHGQTSETRLEFLEKELRRDGGMLVRGGDFDRWDLEVRGGLIGGARMGMAVEDHGSSGQLVRIRLWPKLSPIGLALTLLFAVLAALAANDRAWAAAYILGLFAGVLAIRSFVDCAAATAAILCSLKHSGARDTV